LLVVKYVFRYPVAGPGLPITVTESCALAVTILLARWVAATFEALRMAVFGNLLSDLSSRAHAFEAGQSELYREVRRARSFERPLAFLAVAPTLGSFEAAKDRFTEEVMLRMQRQYVSARVADLLSRRLKDCDVIALRNGHFIAALPETDGDMARTVSQQLQTEARKELGIELSVGVCACPDEEATFVGLLERAEEEMRRAGQSADVGTLSPSENGQLVSVQSLLNGSHEVRKEGDPLLASVGTAPLICSME
jgi:GGDEF domain-containing protein